MYCNRNIQLTLHIFGAVQLSCFFLYSINYQAFFEKVGQLDTTEKVEFPIAENVHYLYIIEPNFM